VEQESRFYTMETMVPAVEKKSVSKYEPPKLTELGTLHDLTLNCNKDFGGTDGFTFQQQPVVCTS
jgi:hypothetical protein